MLVGDVYIAGAVANAIARGAPMDTVAMMGAIHTGEIEVEGGSEEDVQTLFSDFDERVDVGSINLIVR